MFLALTNVSRVSLSLDLCYCDGETDFFVFHWHFHFVPQIQVVNPRGLQPYEGGKRQDKYSTGSPTAYHMFMCDHLIQVNLDLMLHRDLTLVLETVSLQ